MVTCMIYLITVLHYYFRQKRGRRRSVLSLGVEGEVFENYKNILDRESRSDRSRYHAHTRWTMPLRRVTAVPRRTTRRASAQLMTWQQRTVVDVSRQSTLILKLDLDLWLWILIQSELWSRPLHMQILNLKIIRFKRPTGNKRTGKGRDGTGCFAFPVGNNAHNATGKLTLQRRKVGQ